MEFILDCESYDECLLSLAYGFQCSSDELEERIRSLSNDDIFENDEVIDYGSYLLNYISDVFGAPLPLDAVYWFHATRTLESNMFDDGLLNLKDAEPSVWEILIDRAPSEYVAANLQTMQVQGGFDNMYCLRTDDSIHWGPYAALVKALVIDTGETGQRDYLELPELIEDICNGYEKQFGVTLHGYYGDQLVPKLIKFISSYRVDEGCLEAALVYIHSSIHDEDISDCAITCFDGDGSNIPPEEICYVETIDV